jgi:hypothetical protein
MNKMKIMLSGLALLACSATAFAQNEVDALRYSRLDFGGTARIQGIAGAQHALGADASTLSGNPAGLGLYRKSEATFSLGPSFNETSSRYGNTTTTDSRNNFNIPQFGIVFTDRKPDEELRDWRSGSFGISFTRLNSFQGRTSYEGAVMDKNSLLQSLDESVRLNGITKADLDLEYGINGNNITSLEGLGYATGLLVYDTTNQVVYVPTREGVLKQNETILSRGAQNQWDFSYGASYKDKLFVGASLGLMTVNYKQERDYTEISGQEEPYLADYTLTDNFNTRGSGINFRIGLIYKPIDAVRFGGSIQTPTFFSLTDNYGSSIVVNYRPGVFNPTHYTAQTADGIFDYNLTTPFRANGGVAVFIKKYGFISGDIEYLNYSNADFSISDDNVYGYSSGTSYFRKQNDAISSLYQGAINLRIGAEARVLDIFRIRGGFAHYGDPYKNSNADRAKTYYTGGIGLKEKGYFIDAAYVYSTTNSLYSPYKLVDNSQPVIETKHKNESFVITAGLNF